MLHYTDLEAKVLESPLDSDTNQFTVISGYVGHEPIRKLAELPKDVPQNRFTLKFTFGLEKKE